MKKRVRNSVILSYMLRISLSPKAMGQKEILLSEIKAKNAGLGYENIEKTDLEGSLADPPLKNFNAICMKKYLIMLGDSLFFVWL